jgi:hypothetical protein
MGLWVRRPHLSPGEQVQWRAPCNWKQGRRACGGFLWLTDRAVLFEPNRIDALAGGESRRVALAEIAEVALEPGGTPSFSGGLRPRIRLILEDGRQELLLVNQIEARMSALREAVQADA